MTGRRRAIAGGIVLGSGVAVWFLTRYLPAARQPVHLGLALAIGLLAC